MSISIVIRAYNEAENIGRLLFGISQQSLKDVEIVLIDSGSTDATIEVASQYPVKIEHITPEEFTFGRSLNRGIAASTGEIIVITSAHCYPVFPDWLAQLTKPLEDETVALSYGKQRSGTTNHYSEGQFFKKYFPEHSVLQQAQPYTQRQRCHSEGIMGAAQLQRAPDRPGRPGMEQLGNGCRLHHRLRS